LATYRASWSNGTVVRWRDLTWGEYQRLRPAKEVIYPKGSGLIDARWAQEIYKTCLIAGPDPSLVMAGIAQQIAIQQVQNNPFAGDYDSVSKAVEYARQKVNSNYLMAAKARICAAFHYTMEEMDNWTADDFFTKLAQSEIILGSLDVKDPNAKPDPIKIKGPQVNGPRVLNRPQSPSQVKGNVGDPRVPKNKQRGSEVETHTVYSSKYPPK
jgi:hypothetical protein